MGVVLRSAASAVVLVAAACSGTTGGSPSPSPENVTTQPGSPTSSSPTPTASVDSPLPAAEAERVLRSAFAAQRRADTARFTQATRIDAGSQGSLTTAFVGGYRISSNVAQMTMTMKGTGAVSRSLGPAGGKPFRYRQIRGVTFLNVPAWPAPMRKCWMRFSPADISRVTGRQFGETDLPTVHLATLASATATTGTVQGDRTTLHGTVGAVPAAPLFGAEVIKGISKPEALSGRRLPATIVVDGRGVASLELSGGPLADLFETTGQSASASQREVVAATKVLVTYDGFGSPVAVSEPPKRLQVTGNQRTCG